MVSNQRTNHFKYFLQRIDGLSVDSSTLSATSHDHKHTALHPVHLQLPFWIWELPSGPKSYPNMAPPSFFNFISKHQLSFVSHTDSASGTAHVWVFYELTHINK